MTNRANMSQVLLIGMIFSLVFPFYVGGPIFAIGLIILTWIHAPTMISRLGQARDYYILLLSMFVSALLVGNWLGLLMPLTFLVFVIFGLFYKQVMTPRLYWLQARLLLVASIIPSLNSIYRYLMFISEEGYSWQYILQVPNSAFRAESTFFNANYYGLYLVMVLLLGLVAIINKHAMKIPVPVVIIVSVFNLIALFLTQSRMVYPALLAGMITYVSLKKPKWAFIFFSLGGGVLALLIAFPTLMPRFASLEYAFEDRFTIWQVAGQIFLNRPLFGRGAFAYMRFYYLFSDTVKMHSHQLLVDWLANYGLIGLMLTLNAISPFIRSLSLRPKDKENKEGWDLVIAMCVAVLTHSLFDVSIIWLQTGAIFLALILYPFQRGGQEV